MRWDENGGGRGNGDGRGAGELRKWEIARIGGHDGVDDMTCGDACDGGGGRMNSENFGHERAEKHT